MINTIRELSLQEIEAVAGGSTSPSPRHSPIASRPFPNQFNHHYLQVNKD